MSNKRQKITEVMSLLDEEKEALSSNTYLRVAEGLNYSYNKADGGLYVLNWVAHIPEYDEDGDHVEFVRSYRTSLIFLTSDQVHSIKEDITWPHRPHRSPHWECIARTSVGRVPQAKVRSLKIKGEEFSLVQPFLVISLVEYTGPGELE